jgi:hypothetical protein
VNDKSSFYWFYYGGGTLVKKYNGTDVNRLVLLDSNGVIVPSFDTGSGPSSAAVNTLENGRWLVVCRWFFSIFESQNQGRLAKIDADGLLDIAYLTPGVGFDNSVYKVVPLTKRWLLEALPVLTV